jgi:hypothetical protein
MITKNKNEPQVYAVILEAKGNSILHLGIHYNLDDAVEAATPTLQSTASLNEGDNVRVEMWASLKGEDVMMALTEATKGFPHEGRRPENRTAKELLADIKKNKNQLIANVISTRDHRFVEKNPTIFTKAERKYIDNQIFHKVTKSI